LLRCLFVAAALQEMQILQMAFAECVAVAAGLTVSLAGVSWMDCWSHWQH